MRPVTINPNSPASALNEIMRASHEADTTEMAQNFTFDASPTQTLRLLVGSPTLANTNAVLATLLEMLQKGGLNRTT
jgi:hypothetical protein